MNLPVWIQIREEGRVPRVGTSDSACRPVWPPGERPPQVRTGLAAAVGVVPTRGTRGGEGGGVKEVGSAMSTLPVRIMLLRRVREGRRTPAATAHLSIDPLYIKPPVFIPDLEIRIEASHVMNLGVEEVSKTEREVRAILPAHRFDKQLVTLQPFHIKRQCFVRDGRPGISLFRVYIDDAGERTLTLWLTPARVERGIDFNNRHGQTRDVHP